MLLHEVFWEDKQKITKYQFFSFIGKLMNDTLVFLFQLSYESKRFSDQLGMKCIEVSLNCMSIGENYSFLPYLFKIDKVHYILTLLSCYYSYMCLCYLR